VDQLAVTGSSTQSLSLEEAAPLETEGTLDAPLDTQAVRDTTTVTRTISYTYDGLYRLTGAEERPGTTYQYADDLVGNRTEVRVKSAMTESRQYTAADQVIGWSYDAAGNLLHDGTTTYAYDALNRLVRQGGTSYAYNGDGVLIAQTTGSTTTRYTQDLVAPLSQVLQTTQGTQRTDYVSGHERLLALDGTAQTWYGSDALGSVWPSRCSGYWRTSRTPRRPWRR
jgi:YD repeat-containing protein